MLTQSPGWGWAWHYLCSRVFPRCRWRRSPCSGWWWRSPGRPRRGWMSPPLPLPPRLEGEKKKPRGGKNNFHPCAANFPSPPPFPAAPPATPPPHLLHQLEILVCDSSTLKWVSLLFSGCTSQVPSNRSWRLLIIYAPGSELVRWR